MRLPTTCYFLVSVIIFSACKKYPENDRMYLKPIKHRLENHTWRLTMLSINGADSTLAHVHRMLPASTQASDFRIRIDDGFGISDLSITARANVSAPDFGMRLENHKKDIYIEFSKYSKTGAVLWVPESRKWRIKKLTKEEFIIQTNYHNNNIRVEFKKD